MHSIYGGAAGSYALVGGATLGWVNCTLPTAPWEKQTFHVAAVGADLSGRSALAWIQTGNATAALMGRYRYNPTGGHI